MNRRSNLIVILLACTLVMTVANCRRNVAAEAPTSTPFPTAERTPSQATVVSFPTVPVTPTPIVYEVQPGDTLSEIAAAHDTTVRAIMNANGMEDPDFLRIGQKLVIPAPIEPTATPTSAPAE